MNRVFSIRDPYSLKGYKITQTLVNGGGVHFKAWFGWFHLSDFGKTVFETREEAISAHLRKEVKNV